MRGCQNYGPFLGALNIRCRIIIGIQKKDHLFDDHPYRVLGSQGQGIPTSFFVPPVSKKTGNGSSE